MPWDSGGFLIKYCKQLQYHGSYGAKLQGGGAIGFHCTGEHSVNHKMKKRSERDLQFLFPFHFLTIWIKGDRASLTSSSVSYSLSVNVTRESSLSPCESSMQALFSTNLSIMAKHDHHRHTISTLRILLVENSSRISEPYAQLYRVHSKWSPHTNLWHQTLAHRKNQ